MAGIFILFSAVTIAGCSGKATPCTENFILDPTVYGALVSPMNGATAVPASLGTLVFAAPADFSIVLKPMGGSGSTIQTSPTAVPSPYAGTGDFAVTIPTLKAGTTYAAGALSDENQCAGDDTFRTFGTFTTQ
jgi:hypothetical protein